MADPEFVAALLTRKAGWMKWESEYLLRSAAETDLSCKGCGEKLVCCYIARREIRTKERPINFSQALVHICDNDSCRYEEVEVAVATGKTMKSFKVCKLCQRELGCLPPGIEQVESRTGKGLLEWLRSWWS